MRIKCCIEGKYLKSLNKAVGLKLKKIRKAKGFKSQEALADAIGTDAATVSRWETGVHQPSADMLNKLLDVLRIEEESLWPESLNDSLNIPPDILERLRRADETDWRILRRVLGLPDVDPAKRRDESAG